MSALEVLAVGPSVTVQSAARTGVTSLGVPAGGPLDAETMNAALAAVLGSRDDAALELPLHGATFRARGSVVVSLDGAAPVTLVTGDTWTVPVVGRAVRYLAVRGGFDVKAVLGARGTCLPGRFGGFHGRALRRGDVLPIGPAPSGSPAWDGAPPTLLDGPLTCIPTARAARDATQGRPALEALLAQSFTVDSRSDRVGTRLAGASATLRELARALGSSPARSRPTARGAIQLPPGGEPIVLGPDGPTLGGYPVLAVLEREACARLARLRPGAAVTFGLGRALT